MRRLTRPLSSMLMRPTRVRLADKLQSLSPANFLLPSEERNLPDIVCTKITLTTLWFTRSLSNLADKLQSLSPANFLLPSEERNLPDLVCTKITLTTLWFISSTLFSSTFSRPLALMTVLRADGAEMG